MPRLGIIFIAIFLSAILILSAKTLGEHDIKSASMPTSTPQYQLPTKNRLFLTKQKSKPSVLLHDVVRGEISSSDGLKDNWILYSNVLDDITFSMPKDWGLHENLAGIRSRPESLDLLSVQVNSNPDSNTGTAIWITVPPSSTDTWQDWTRVYEPQSGRPIAGFQTLWMPKALGPFVYCPGPFIATEGSRLLFVPERGLLLDICISHQTTTEDLANLGGILDSISF